MYNLYGEWKHREIKLLAQGHTVAEPGFKFGRLALGKNF